MPNPYNLSNLVRAFLKPGAEDMPPLPPDPRDQGGFTPSEKPPHQVEQVKLKDYREGVNPLKSFSGSYPINIIRELISGAKAKAIDPSVVLSMGLQESTLGKRAPSNPLQLNREATPSQWPSDTLLGGIDDNATSQEAKDALDREYSIGQSLDYLKSRLGQQGGNVGEALHDYNGRGRAITPYAPRVLDLKSNVIDKSPLIQELIKRTK